MPGDPTHLDHFVPLSKGGTNDLRNMRLMHATCNLTKGNSIK